MVCAVSQGRLAMQVWNRDKRYGRGCPRPDRYSVLLYCTTIFRQREEPAADNDQTDVCAELISIFRAWASSWREYGFLMN